MNDLLTPETVLEKFDTLRADVLGVIDRGERLASQFPAIAAAATIELGHVRRLVSDSHLSLVVVGGEGAGKSTLVRGILKQELAPIERNQPGTVAPVYLAYGAGAPTFTVEFSEKGKAPERCDKQTYFKYILQKTNQGNIEKVHRALVTVDNELLKKGLVLVDMPGVGGVSDAVRVEAQNFIRDQAAAVVGVAKERTYGPLLDIARDFSMPDAPLRYQAVISNRPSDYFAKPDEPDLQPRPDHELAKEIEETRRDGQEVMRREFQRLNLEQVIEGSELFVFSAAILFTSPKHKLATPPHRAEMERFLDKLSRYVQEKGLAVAVLGSARRVEDVLGRRITSYVAARRDVLERVLRGDRDLLANFKASAEQALRAMWSDRAHNEDLVQRLVADACSELAGVLAQQRSDAVGRISRLIQQIEATGKLSSEAIRDRVASLRSEIADQVYETNKRFLATLGKAHAVLVKRANELLTEALAPVPIFHAYGTVAVRLTADDIIRQRMQAAEQGEGWLNMRSLDAVAGLAAPAGGGAMLLLIPDPSFVTQAIGLTLLGSAQAWKTIKENTGIESRMAVRYLRQMRDDLLRQEIDHDEALREELSAAIGKTRGLIDTALMERLAQIEALMQDPGKERVRIETERDGLNRLYEELKQLEVRLLQIRNQARDEPAGV